ncbi:unnamed protein product [Trichobilharzia szidati]|nr:unnamed protein product [Trichobilharzia szidati]
MNKSALKPVEVTEKVNARETSISKPNTKSTACLPKPSSMPKHDESNNDVASNQLVMPRPPANCIWSQNPDCLPIVDVALESKFASRLQPHQRDGVIFLYKCLMGYQPYVAINDSITGNIYGCILADEMGLGKTVQAIAVIWLLIKQGPYGNRPVIRRCLIVTPGTLVQNWSKEFSKWLGRERLPIYCVDQNHSVKALCKLRANRRLLLTGTPLQNHLNELWSLANFCVPGRLTSSLEEFRRQFVIPLLNSRKLQSEKPSATSAGTTTTTHESGEDDTDDGDDDFWNYDTATAAAVIDDDDDSSDLESPSAKLIRLMNSFFLRRTSDVIAPKLTNKTEHIVFCRPSKLQTDLESVLTEWMNKKFNINRRSKFEEDEDVEGSDEDFDEAIEEVFAFPSSSSSSASKHHNTILSIITAFRKLHNHPYLLSKYLTQFDAGKNFTDNRLPSKLTEDLLQLLNTSNSVNEDIHQKNSNEFIQLSGKFNTLYFMLKRLFSKHSSSGSSLLSSATSSGIQSNVKLQKRPRLHKAMNNTATNNVPTKDRLILVSNFTQTLDLLEKLCNLVTGQSCLRLDGQTTNKQRNEIVQRINDPKSNDCILLLSSRAGGTGLNLIGANYLILFDMDWNPANDAQAMARIWRPGQLRPVRLYRLVTAGGMEERIFQRQAAKLALTSQTLVNSSMYSNNNHLYNFIDKKSNTKSGILTRDELKELFLIPNTQTVSWTHDLIQCNCQQSVEVEANSAHTPSPSLSTSSSSSGLSNNNNNDPVKLEHDKENISRMHKDTASTAATAAPAVDDDGGDCDFDEDSDDEFSDIRVFQLSTINPHSVGNSGNMLKSPKSQFNFIKQQSMLSSSKSSSTSLTRTNSSSTKTTSSSSSDSLGFLLNWKHSLSVDQMSQLEDPLLINDCQLDPMTSLISCIFTLETKTG